MFPSSSYMDPYYSQNKDQPYPSYPFYPYPVPRPDPSAQPASYAPWLYHFNPAQPNGGTGYPYPPGYYGPRPAFAYEMPPPNFPNYHHPSFAQMPSYPAKCPQVEHTTDQMHCCGCPNHVCHGTHSPKVRIEEETPDVDLTKMPTNSHPFFWFSPRNVVQRDEIEQPKKERKGAQFPWPIVWMPEDEMKNKEKKNARNKAEQDEIEQRKKERKGAQFPWPIVWMPEDEMKEKEKKNTRNKVERDEIEQPKKEMKGAQFPWPIIWMPEDEMKEKAKKDTQFPWPIFWMPEDESKERKDQQANKRASEEATKPSFRIIPLKFLENGDKDQAEVQKPPFIEKKQGAEETMKEARKDQMEQRDKRQAEVKSIPVLERKENGEKVGKEQPIKETDDTVTEKKRSKLPPVCLRVDPLPVKRTTNGSSKDKDKKEVKVVDVKGAKDERKGVEVEIKKDAKEKLPERRNDDAKRGVEGKELNEKSEKGKVENVKRSHISEQDAALLIQSAYRGYNVRRLDPVNKLKKIRSVHENAQELLKKLQDIEESSKQLEKKEQLVLSESIMNLLLQLDTIQGLHPTVREARKLVAKELVSLQEKLDSLEKREAIEMPANEISQPQMEVQPAATNDASEGCKLVSEQVESQASETPTPQCSATQEDEKAHDSAAIDLPPVEVPVINEEATCSIAREESQVTPLLEETRPNDLVEGSILGENHPEAKPWLRQTENLQGVGSTENVVSDATMEVPSAAVESGATGLAAAVTSSESSAAAPHTLSECEMLDTAATSKITEEIHDTEVAPGVAVTDGTDMAATLPGVELDRTCEEKGHATESNAEEAGSEVALSDAITKEANMLEGCYESDAGAKVENVELQTTEDGKPSSKEMKAEEDNEIVSHATSTASAEVEVELHATEVPSEGGNANDGVAGEDNVALLAPEADKVEDESKSVEKDKVTTLPGTEEYSIPGNEVAGLPDTGNASNANDGVASAENVELLAPEADKVEDENKSVEENEVTTLPGTEEHSIPGNEESGLPDTENSEGIQHTVEVDEPKAEVFPDAIQTDATEIPQPEVSKLSAEEQKLVEENEKLRAMLEKLMEAGRNQLDIISGLNERVKGLEKKLEKKSKKSKVKVKKHKPVTASPIEVV